MPNNYELFVLRMVGLVGRVFANGLGDLGSIPDCVIPMVRETWVQSPVAPYQRL